MEKKLINVKQLSGRGRGFKYGNCGHDMPETSLNRARLAGIDSGKYGLGYLGLEPANAASIRWDLLSVFRPQVAGTEQF